jgi:PAS domain S-box-containing protein
MPQTLTALLAESQEDVIARWTTRLARSRVDAPGLSPASREATLRAALADVIDELDRGAGTQPPRPRASAPIRTTEDLLTLILGRDALQELVAERLHGPDAQAGIAALSDAFEHLFAERGQSACGRCLSVHDENRLRIERRLEAVVEQSLDAIVLCDSKGVIEGWNQGATELFGYVPLEIVGHELTQLAPDGAAPALRETLARVLANGHARAPEIELLTRPGKRVWVDASYTRVLDPGGSSPGVWAVFRDVTEQRRLAAEKLSAERLALIGTMSAKFAHEIRNPLASILLNIELIEDVLKRRPAGHEETPGEDEEIVGSISSEVGRIQRVVQDYLRFARLPHAQREAVDLDAALRRHLSSIEPELRQADVRLTVDLGGEGRLVAADADQIWQAVLNLVRNAMEALPHGGRVAVTTKATDAGLACSVVDDGPGIPPEVAERIFLPFFSTKHAGTGLGLPFVRQVLVEHGSTLELDAADDPAPGRGARFHFVLPYADGE